MVVIKVTPFYTQVVVNSFKDLKNPLDSQKGNMLYARYNCIVEHLRQTN